jgi:hypothetical protein
MARFLTSTNGYHCTISSAYTRVELLSVYFDAMRHSGCRGDLTVHADTTASASRAQCSCSAIPKLSSTRTHMQSAGPLLTSDYHSSAC